MNIDRLTSSSFAERAASNKRLLEDLKLPQERQPKEPSKPDTAKNVVDTVNISREAARTLSLSYATDSKPADRKELDRARIDAQISATSLKFETTTPGQIVVKLVDVNGEVIRQMPPEIAVKLAQALKEKASEMVRESIGQMMGYGSDQKKLDELLKRATPDLGSAVGSTLSERA